MTPHFLGEDLVKDAGALGWSDLAGGEASLIERCVAGEELACAELVAGHERMVYTLALHLLGDRDEALDLSQEVFLRVFRTIHSFRGQSALRTGSTASSSIRPVTDSASGAGGDEPTRFRSTSTWRSTAT